MKVAAGRFFVIGRIKRLFSRYTARHLKIDMPLTDRQVFTNAETGPAPGYVQQVVLRNNHLTIKGAAHTEQVIAENGVARRVVHLEASNDHEERQFSVQLPFDRGETRIAFGDGQDMEFALLPEFSSVQILGRQLMLLPGFFRALARAIPAAVRWYRFHDPSARTEVRNLLGLAPLGEALRLDEAFFNEAEAENRKTSVAHLMPPIVIVMPVYNAFDVLQKALDRVSRNTHGSWRMVLVDDGSTDPRVAPYLDDWSTNQGPHVTLLKNEKNLGFIGAVNRGFAHALELFQDQPNDSRAAVVVLNSDALVPEGWAERLTAPLSDDPSIASVTPMSNDAELLTVPTLCARHVLSKGVADHIDRVAAALPDNRFLRDALRGTADMPTGVGFCMALGLRYLRWLPEFDRAFGAGYGEEVDWCQKIIEHGGRHVAQPRLFVEHHGGASFGSEQKTQLLAKNGALISRRYPRFDQQVQDYIADDPLLSIRIVLGLAWVSAEAEANGATNVPVYVGHSMGGGAEMDLMRRMDQDITRQGAAVVLRVGGSLRWQIEIHSAAGITRGAADDIKFVAQLLSFLPKRRIIYSCGVGDEDPAELPDCLLKLAKGAAGGIEVLFHDYLPLSPSYTLLDSDGSWRGVPGPDTKDRAHIARRANGTPVDLAAWRKAWGELLAAADRIEVFSQSSRDLVAEAYPALAKAITVAPHTLLHPVPRVPKSSVPEQMPVIGVLGNIGPHKGAHVLTKLDKRLSRTRAAKLVLIGNLDPSFRVTKHSVVHGDYGVEEIPDLVVHYKISCWLIPSVWPETFSFTTHEALATGLPVIAFDLGAQGDLLTSAPNGHVLPISDGMPDLDNLLDLVSEISHETGHE